jgi:superfamily I DNA/RNA helicase
LPVTTLGLRIPNRSALTGQAGAFFLYRDQRRVAYRDYNGPALVRGGAGTGKTVVAMHRAKHLADQIAADPTRSPERVLFTTFTTNLAIDIRSNMKTLCPEHLEGQTRGSRLSTSIGG